MREFFILNVVKFKQQTPVEALLRGLGWCHRLANLILSATIFRIKFDSHTYFDTRCN